MKSMYRHAPRIDRSESAAPARKRPRNKAKGAKLQKPQKKPQKPQRAPKATNAPRSTGDAGRGEGERLRLPSLPWRPTLWVLVACSILAALAFVAMAGWQALRGAERLAVERVDVQGASAASVKSLLAHAGVREGQSILDVELDEAARNVRRHPWIADATVVRAFPNRVTIRVTEHRPGALVTLEGLYLVNTEGEVFKRWSTKDPRGLPVVTGIDRDLVTRSPERAAELLREAMGLAEELEGWLDTVGELEEVHFDEALGWSVVTRPPVADGEPVTLALGFDGHQRLALAARSLIELGRRSLTPAVVWADGTKHPTRVQARLRLEESTGKSLTSNEVSQ